MNPYVIDALFALGVWTAVGYAIWKWGPGLRKRRVRCPEKNIAAAVLADQRETEFGCLRVVDVRTCSLAPGTPLACGKPCVARL